MPQTINAAAERAFSRSNVEPIGLITIHLPPKRCLTVTDWTAIAAGSLIRIQINAVTYTITEGVEWNATTSNAATAESIRLALNNLAVGNFPNVRCRREDTRIIVAGAATVAILTWPQLPAAGVAELVQPPPTQRKFLLGCTQTLAQQTGGYPLSVAMIGGVEQGLDALTREFSMGDLDIEFVDDGEVRRLLLDHHLRGRQVDYALGTPDLLEAQFVPQGSWYIEDVKPASDGSLVMKLHDGMGFFRDRTIAKRWVNEHPIDVFRDVLQSGVDASGLTGSLTGLVDETTLDPSVDPETAHWTVSRYGDAVYEMGDPIDEPEPVIDILNSLMPMLGGTWSPDFDNGGRYYYRPFDESAAPLFTWRAGPEDGYDVEDVEIVETWANAANEVHVDFASQEGGNRTRFTARNDRSRNELGRLYSLVIDTDWINSVAELFPSGITGPSQPPFEGWILLADSTAFAINLASRQGFCGSRFRASGSTFVPDANGDLDGAAVPPRRAYFRLEGAGYTTATAQDSDVPPEIIACDDSQVLSGVSPDDANVRGDIPATVRFSIATGLTDPTLGFVSGRAGFGTTTPYGWNIKIDPFGSNVFLSNFERARIIDITIAVEMALRRLRRFAYGAPIIRVRTGLEQLRYELADFGAIDGDHVYLAFGKDGLTTTTIWEVTKKNVSPWGDTPCIEWELTWVRDDFVDQVTFPVGFYPEAQLELVQLEILEDEVITDDGDDVTDEDFEQVIVG
jgi:hypothetical protein